MTTLQFSVAMIIGMLAGRAAAGRLSSQLVQIGFSVVLLLVAIGLVVKALVGEV